MCLLQLNKINKASSYWQQIKRQIVLSSVTFSVVSLPKLTFAEDIKMTFVFCTVNDFIPGSLQGLQSHGFPQLVKHYVKFNVFTCNSLAQSFFFFFVN